MKGKRIAPGFEWETPEVKARWFQSLTVEERMRWLCEEYDKAVAANPDILKREKYFPHAQGRVQILRRK